MGFAMDAEVSKAMTPMLAAALAVPPPQVGDWHTRRVNAEHDLDAVTRNLPPVTGINVTDHSATAEDGTEVQMLLYRRADAHQPRSAVLYLHGGGFIVGWQPM